MNGTNQQKQGKQNKKQPKQGKHETKQPQSQGQVKDKQKLTEEEGGKQDSKNAGQMLNTIKERGGGNVCIYIYIYVICIYIYIPRAKDNLKRETW